MDGSCHMRRISERCSLKLGCCYFALVADASVLLFFSQWASTGWTEVGLLLIDGLLLFSTAVATASNISILLLPNLVFRALLLTSMMFFSCFAVDSLLRPEDPLQLLQRPQETTTDLGFLMLRLFFTGPGSSDSFQTEVRRKIVENPQIAVVSPFFCVLFIIEFKLFVQVWRNLQHNDRPMTTPVIEKPPPPYSVCLEEDALPNYEQVAASSRSSSISRPRASISLAGKAPMPLPI